MDLNPILDITDKINQHRVDDKIAALDKRISECLGVSMNLITLEVLTDDSQTVMATINPNYIVAIVDGVPFSSIYLANDKMLQSPISRETILDMIKSDKKQYIK
jgi:hypothetical protein